MKASPPDLVNGGRTKLDMVDDLDHLYFNLLSQRHFWYLYHQLAGIVFYFLFMRIISRSTLLYARANLIATCYALLFILDTLFLCNLLSYSLLLEIRLLNGPSGRLIVLSKSQVALIFVRAVANN